MAQADRHDSGAGLDSGQACAAWCALTPAAAPGAVDGAGSGGSPCTSATRAASPPRPRAIPADEPLIGEGDRPDVLGRFLPNTDPPGFYMRKPRRSKRPPTRIAQIGRPDREFGAGLMRPQRTESGLMDAVHEQEAPSKRQKRRKAPSPPLHPRAERPRPLPSPSSDDAEGLAGRKALRERVAQGRRFGGRVCREWGCRKGGKTDATTHSRIVNSKL